MNENWKARPHVMDRPITEQERAHLEEYGYVVFENVLEESVCDQLVEELFALASSMYGIQKGDKETWSAIPFHGNIHIWHSKTLNNCVRQHPLLYSIFAQLLHTHKLTVSVDRFGLKAPCNPKERRERKEMNQNLKLHHDLNIWHSKPDCPYYQAGIAIADCPVGGGGFFCVPGHHKIEVISKYKDYKQAQSDLPPPGSNKKFISFDDQWEGMKQFKTIEVPLKKGDMILWNGFLPHNGGFNTLVDHWRLHCFIRFVPLAGPFVGTDTERQFNIRYQKMVRTSIEAQETPLYYSTGNSVSGSPKNKVVDSSPISYSWLGKRILGVEKWNDLHDKQVSIYTSPPATDSDLQ